MVCATSKASDQPTHMRSLICLCKSLAYSMTVKLLTEQHLEFLRLKGGCTGLSVYTCQNATLLEILCRGSFSKSDEVFSRYGAVTNNVHVTFDLSL